MGKNLTRQIIESHLVKGIPEAGNPIELKIDNTLTQDATGTMTYLQLEAMDIRRVQTKRSVSYVDHNTLQNGYMNADDHKYLQGVADRYGVYYSRCGNGICHQVQLERFDIPGETLLGSDSHTPTAGGMGTLGIGAGGLDVACAMAGRPFSLNMPKVVNVILNGRLGHGVTAKDIILKVLSLLSVKGGVGKVMEYTGEGVRELSVPERSTITNMGAELGATSSLFPSDEKTLEFLKKQGREQDWKPLAAEPDAQYDETIVIDLGDLKPLVACPDQPDHVKDVAAIAGMKVDQVCIGSCTNSSVTDIMTVANILRGHTVSKDVSLTISCGSRQVTRMLAENGDMAVLIAAGARMLENTCGPCIGMGQSPCTNAVSLRTFNRNFYGRSQTLSAGIYLVSPETAAVSAITGVLTDPSTVPFEKAAMPEHYAIDDSMILAPSCDPSSPIIKGPNIKSIPLKEPLAAIDAKVMIKVGDDITTDHIMPAGGKVLPYRSNIEKMSEFCFQQIDEGFSARCRENKKGIIVAGSNYGQGSSREHAAMAPMFLGIQAVIAKSYARIHKQNLINNGILPLRFLNDADYDSVSLLDELEIVDVQNLEAAKNLTVRNRTSGTVFTAANDLTEEQVHLIRCGGLLNAIRKDGRI